MGLTISHGTFEGAYGTFTEWRRMVGRAAGYSYHEFTSEDGYTFLSPDLDWESIEDENMLGYWENEPGDPLIYLLAHSDTEGKLTSLASRALAERLEMLLDRLPIEVQPWSLLSPRVMAEKFIQGLRTAAAQNEDVNFS